jgi:hypothetical protein
MKKIALIIAVLVLFTIDGKSQDFRKRLTIGPKIGLNLSNVYDSEGENFDADAKFGMAVGAFISVPLGSLFGVQPEALYSQKGFKASGTVLGIPYTYTRTLNYIDIPLLITLKPTQRFTIMAGPQYSYLISSKSVFTNSLLTVDEEEEFENDNIRNNTLCFLGGLDMNFSHVVLGARVGWDLFENSADGSSIAPRYKNVWYQLTLGYRL